jgi:hypothetical protein
MTRDDYLSLRRKYEPKPAKLAIVAESPPASASGRYFYNPKGKPSEPLFSALMRQLRFSARTKEDGLAEFQQRGWVLVDATYEPVNKHADSGRNIAISQRNSVIERDYPKLRDDLDRLMPDRSTPIILIKANVCQVLEPKLAKDGYTVLNRGSIPFPSHSHQKKFHQEFSAVVKSAGL